MAARTQSERCAIDRSICKQTERRGSTLSVFVKLSSVLRMYVYIAHNSHKAGVRLRRRAREFAAESARQDVRRMEK